MQKENNKYNYKDYPTKVITTANNKKTNDINYERIPYHKSTDLIIERIKRENESKSPDKPNNLEMFRDIKELSKKYEIINSRKNRRQSYSNFKKGNDLSFNSYSVERNKEKEKWEKNLEKERQMKKIKEQKKELKNKQKPKEKNNLIFIQNNENKENSDNKNMKIRNKYKKMDFNNKNKLQMRIVKKIQTRDKKIHININHYRKVKYLILPYSQ